MSRRMTLEQPVRSLGVPHARMLVRDGETVVEDIETEVAFEAVYELVNHHTFKSVLDVGCGNAEHSRIFRAMGYDVTTLDPYFPADIHEEFMTAKFDRKFDVVFCSHVLEHQRNIGQFLDKLTDVCEPDGLICISVPPEVHHAFLLCHPNQFNAGKLIYQLVLAGIDCRDAQFLTYGYNLSVIVRNKRHPLARRDYAYEEEVRQYFPACFTGTGKQIYGAQLSNKWNAQFGMPPHSNAGLPTGGILETLASGAVNDQGRPDVLRRIKQRFFK